MSDTPPNTLSLSGGCQCGAVRYRFSAKPDDVSICHCRMCQKATGGMFGAFAGGPIENFSLTRGTLSVFRSSDSVERGFCARCGTPLTFARVGGAQISVTLGSLDHPADFVPTEQTCPDGRLPYTLALHDVADLPPIEEAAPELAVFIASTNHQHPDHDTEQWPA
jgi:hypothetical protein